MTPTFLLVLMTVLQCSLVGKTSACHAGDLSSIPGSGRSPGGGQGYPLQYSCLESSRDRGAWRATVPGVAKVDTSQHYRSLFLSRGFCGRPSIWACLLLLLLTRGLQTGREDHRGKCPPYPVPSGDAFPVIHAMDPWWLTSRLPAPLKALLSVLHPLRRSHSRQSTGNG